MAPNFFIPAFTISCLFVLWSSNMMSVVEGWNATVNGTTIFSFSLATLQANATNGSDISIAGPGLVNDVDNVTTLVLNPELLKGTTVRALFNNPFPLESVNGTPYSFSTNFTFSVTVNTSLIRGDGFTFTIGSTAPTDTLNNDTRASHLGLFHPNDLGGSPAVKTFAVEFDCYKNADLGDVNNNHVGVDINDLISSISADLGPSSITLSNGGNFTCSIDYNAILGVLTVYLVNGVTVKKDPGSIVLTTGLNLGSDLSATSTSTFYTGFTLGTGGGTLGLTILSWDISAWPVQQS